MLYVSVLKKLFLHFSGERAEAAENILQEMQSAQVAQSDAI